MGLVLMGVGFTSGVGIALFRSGPTAPTPAVQPALVAPVVKEQPSAQPASSPSNPPAAIAAASRLPERFSSPLSAASVSEYSERSLQSRQLHKQLQDTLDSQAFSPPSSLGILNQDNKPSSRRHPFPQPWRQRESLKVSLNLLQWSSEVEKRLAVISVNSGPMLTVHEGDTVSDLAVEHILPDAVELRFGDSAAVKLRLGNSILYGQTTH